VRGSTLGRDTSSFVSNLLGMDGERLTYSLKDGGSQKRWQGLLPLNVLYSPILRLRFRAALSTVMVQANDACARSVFGGPCMAANALAVLIEQQGWHNVPQRTVYVRDCESRKDTDAHVSILGDRAIVYLPENEKSPYSTIEITTKAVLELLQVPLDLGDKFSEKVVDFLKKAYSEQ
jgi:hypothetical protein